MSQEKKYDYYAFISYKHTQKETNKFVADEKWAHILKKQLELWHIPTQIPEESRINKNDRRIYPVFRDAENYPSGHELNELTYDYLSKCKTLVVVLSKEMLDDQIDLRYKQNESAWIFNEIEYFISLGNTTDSIVIFYVGDDDIDPNALLKEKIDFCNSNNWDCKVLKQLYQPGKLIKRLRDFKDKGKEINQYVTAVVAAGIFNADPRYFINAYELERKNKRNKIIIFLLVLLIILIGLIASIFSQHKSKRTEEAFRYVELSRKAENAHDLQGAKILALKAYEAKPDLLETQQQIFRVSKEEPMNPYASLPYQTLFSFDGREIMHFQNDQFFIRRTSDLAIIDSIDIYSQEEVLLNSNCRQIAFIGYDSFKIYDRDTKQFVLSCNCLYSSGLLSPMTDFCFPKMSNRFICLDWDGYVIDWDLVNKDSIMVPIKEIINRKSCDDNSDHVFLKFHGNSNDSCVIISYTIDYACHIHEYNCVTRTINKLDSFYIDNARCFYNSNNSSFLVCDNNQAYIKPIGRDKLIIDTSDVDVPYHFNNPKGISSQYDYLDVFTKKGDKFFLRKGESISIYSSNGILIKRINVDNSNRYFNRKKGYFLCANWTTDGDICVQYEKKCYILLEKDNYDSKKAIEYSRYEAPKYFDNTYCVNVLDSAIIETTQSYDTRTYSIHKALTRCYHKKKLDIDESQKGKYYLPDGIHYIENHEGFIEPSIEYRVSGFMNHTRCVNSLNDSVAWKFPYGFPYGDIEISPNKEKVCVNDGYQFYILNSKTGTIVYKNKMKYYGNTKFLSDDIIQYDVNDSISAVFNMENMQLLVEGRLVECKVEKNRLAYIIEDSINYVNVLDIESGQKLITFPIPNFDSYDFYFSPHARYLIIPSRDYLPSPVKVINLDSIRSNIVLIDLKKRTMMQNGDVSSSCMFTKDEKYVITLFLKHANVYRVKDFSLVKTFNFSGYAIGITSYVSKYNVFIKNEADGGYELCTKKWTISDSEYQDVIVHDNFVWIDGYLYEKEPLLKRNEKKIAYMTENHYSRRDVEFINDSIILYNEQLHKIRSVDELAQELKKKIGERVLTQYEINCYNK